MVTPYDIHDTMVDMIYGYENLKIKSRYGKSLFRNINGMERNCDNYEELIKSDLCRCIKF